MGWEIGYDTNWKRDIGYGVPALCDHPRCKKEIDRGLRYVCCGEEPYGGENGCGLYFCFSHLRFGEHRSCKRCAKGKEPFKPKPELKRWTKHKEMHPSWAKWRREREKK